MVYQMQVPPFEIETFEKLSAKQAKDIFHWYIGEIPFRLKQLQEYLDTETNNSIMLTKEIDTLSPLWKWFCNTIQTREKTAAEIQEELLNTPEWLHPVVRSKKEKPTYETLAVAMDIAIYFAEVIIHHNPCIQWGYFTRPKSRVSVNEPTLVGFSDGMDLNPRLIVNNLLLKHIRTQETKDLKAVYDIWLSYIPSP